MKHLASITALILSACAYVSTGVAVPPPSDFVDTEAVTNVVFDAGDIYGVNYSLDASGRKVWRKDDAAVDFPWASANPIHR